MKKIFFKADLVPPAQSEYVCWLDVMGTQATMSYSLAKSVNYICKLHTAALEASQSTVSIYPMLDGMYVTSTTQIPLLNFLRTVLYRVADNFVAEEEHYHRFLVKAAVAYGPVTHGKQIPSDAGMVFKNYPNHRDSLLFGLPIIQSFQSEKNAPPFGVFIHESARSFAPDGERPFPYIWWRWLNPADTEFAHTLKKTLSGYFDFCRKNSKNMSYPLERINEHQNSSREYFYDL